jgi:hypothetical protein
MDAITRLRLQNLRRQNQEMQFLLQDALATKDSESIEAYRSLINDTRVRFNRLYKAMGERSLTGRRQREDAAIRIPLTEE